MTQGDLFRQKLCKLTDGYLITHSYPLGQGLGLECVGLKDSSSALKSEVGICSPTDRNSFVTFTTDEMEEGVWESKFLIDTMQTIC